MKATETGPFQSYFEKFGPPDKDTHVLHVCVLHVCVQCVQASQKFGVGKLWVQTTLGLKRRGGGHKWTIALLPKTYNKGEVT